MFKCLEPRRVVNVLQLFISSPPQTSTKLEEFWSSSPEWLTLLCEVSLLEQFVSCLHCKICMEKQRCISLSMKLPDTLSSIIKLLVHSSAQRGFLTRPVVAADYRLFSKEDHSNTYILENRKMFMYLCLA